MGKILILEPHPEVRELFQRVATRLGYEGVTEVPSDGLAGPVDAIVVEPQGAHARAVARALHDRFPEIPVVCASTVPATPEVRRDLGPRAYLNKPFHLRDLEDALKVALGRAT